MSDNMNAGGTGSDILVFTDIPHPARAEALSGILKDVAGLTCVESLEALEHAAQADPQARMVVVFMQPDIDIGRALESGTAAKKALEGWTKRTGALLDLLRRNRRRLALIDDITLFADPDRAQALLGTPLDPPAEDEQSSALLRLVGQAVLARDARAAALAGELVASSQGGEGKPVNLQSAQDEFTTLRHAIERENKVLREVEQYKASLTARQEEHDSILAELLTLQETVSTNRDELERKSAQLVQLRQGLESGEAQIRQLEQALKTAEARAGTLQQDLSAQQRRHTEESREQATLAEQSLSALNERSLALEKLEAEAEDLRRAVQDRGGEVALLTQRLAEADATRRAQEAEIAAFYSSKSYRMTAPLRWLSAALRRGQ